MNQEDLSVKEKLILATIEIIEEEGMEATTIRNIAKYANANSAAINYYFGTKERLLEDALTHTLNHSFSDIMEVLQNPAMHPYDAMREALLYLLLGGIQHPNITKVHFYEPIMHNNYEGKSTAWIYSFLEQLMVKSRELLSPCTENELQMITVQIMSAVLSPALFPGMFPGLDFQQVAVCNEYLDSLLKRFFRSDLD